MKNNKFAVIGLGVFGSAIARKLAERGADVMAIDENEEKVQQIAPDVAYAVALDATNTQALEAQNLTEVDAVVVSIGSSFQEMLLCVFQLQELQVKRIIARAQGPVQRKILEKMGVDHVLSPELEVANNVVEQLTNPGVLMCVQLPDEYEIIEVQAPAKIIGRTLEDIGLRKKYNINLVTLIRKEGDNQHHIYGVPSPETLVDQDDRILVFGQVKDINRFIEINA
ncbi:MAG: potassium channel family protein [Schleiferiaceae bacterium]|jgi:trk system potassium uptake protein TrkA|nr:MAG: Ktr system potassium uptake protein A [Cryomorphaceae bacterium]